MVADGRWILNRLLLEGEPAIAVAQWRALSTAIPDDGYAALNLARAQVANGDLDAAAATLRKLTVRDENDPRAWLELGKAAIKQGDADPAVNGYLQRALLLYRGGRDQYGVAETNNTLGIGYIRLGEIIQAEEQYQKATALQRDIGDRRGIATSLHNLAAIANLRGEFKQAAGYLDEARALYAAIGDRRGLALVENQSGLLAEKRGNFRAALAAYCGALSARRQIGNHADQARSLYDIGNASYQLGDYAGAQASWQQAADIYNKLGDVNGSVRTELSLGLLDIARGQWDEARQRLLRSLAVAQKQGMREEVAYTRRYLAELEYWQGHWQAALGQMDQAEALFVQIEDSHGLIDTRLLRAQTLLATHADAEAQRILEALAPALAKASQEYRAIAAVIRVELAQRQGHLGRARNALAQARGLADATGIRRLQVQTELLSAKLQPPGDLAKLDADTAAFGHAGLRLAFIELALSQALETNDGTAAAVNRYRQAQSLLLGGDYLHAAQVHALGAVVLAAHGEIAGAASARLAAREARAATHAQIERMAAQGQPRRHSAITAPANPTSKQ